MKYLQNRLSENEDWGRFVFTAEGDQPKSLQDILSQNESVGIVDVDQGNEADEHEEQILEFATGIEETVKTLSPKEQENILKELKKLDTKYEKEENTELQELQAGLTEIKEKYFGLEARTEQIIDKADTEGMDNIQYKSRKIATRLKSWHRKALDSIPEKGVDENEKQKYMDFLIKSFNEKIEEKEGKQITGEEANEIKEEMEALTFDKWKEEQEKAFIGPLPADKEKANTTTEQIEGKGPSMPYYNPLEKKITVPFRVEPEEGDSNIIIPYREGVSPEQKPKEVSTGVVKDGESAEATSIDNTGKKELTVKTAPAKIERVTNPDEVEGKNWYKDVGGIEDGRKDFRTKYYEKRVENMELADGIAPITDFKEQTISKEGGYLFGALVRGLKGEWKSNPEKGKKAFDKNSDAAKQAFLILKKLSADGVNVDKFNAGDKIKIQDGVFNVNGEQKGGLLYEVVESITEGVDPLETIKGEYANIKNEHDTWLEKLKEKETEDNEGKGDAADKVDYISGLVTDGYIAPDGDFTTDEKEKTEIQTEIDKLKKNTNLIKGKLEGLGVDLELEGLKGTYRKEIKVFDEWYEKLLEVDKESMNKLIESADWVTYDPVEDTKTQEEFRIIIKALESNSKLIKAKLEELKPVEVTPGKKLEELGAQKEKLSEQITAIDELGIDVEGIVLPDVPATATEEANQALEVALGEVKKEAAERVQAKIAEKNEEKWAEVNDETGGHIPNDMKDAAKSRQREVLEEFFVEESFDLPGPVMEIEEVKTKGFGRWPSGWIGRQNKIKKVKKMGKDPQETFTEYAIQKIGDAGLLFSKEELKIALKALTKKEGKIDPTEAKEKIDDMVRVKKVARGEGELEAETQNDVLTKYKDREKKISELNKTLLAIEGI